MLSPLWSGIRRFIPLAFGYVPVGFAYGVLAVQNGIPAWAAVLTSIFVYAGSSQLIAARLIGAGAPVLSIVMTTFVVNLRHILMATALTPWLTRLPRPWLVFFGFELTDETFALHSAQQRQGQPPIPAELLSLHMAAHCIWVICTAIGAYSGNLLGDTRPFGLDFTLAAMFIALLVPQCLNRLYILAGLAAAFLSISFTLLGAGRWAVVAATVLTVCLAGWIEQRRNRIDASEQKGVAA